MLLKARQRQGEIKDLVLQPRFPLMVDGVLVCTYISDFQFFDLDEGRLRLIDVKGVRTDLYRLKKKLMKAKYPELLLEEV